MAKEFRVTREQLVKAAEDMNEVMGLEPQIDVSLPVGELLEMMKEAFQYVEPDDEFTMETWDIINADSNGLLEVVEEEIREKEEEVVNVLPRVRKGRNIFGRIETSRYGRMDDLLLKGTTYDEMVEMLMSQFSVSERKALFTVKKHIYDIQRRKEAEVIMNGDEIRIEVKHD